MIFVKNVIKKVNEKSKFIISESKLLKCGEWRAEGGGSISNRLLLYHSLALPVNSEPLHFVRTAQKSN